MNKRKKEKNKQTNEVDQVHLTSPFRL